MRARIVLSPAVLRQQESSGARGHLLLCGLANEAVARYRAIQEPGRVVHWANSHVMHPIPDATCEAQREAAFRCVIAAIDRYLQTPRPAKETP